MFKSNLRPARAFAVFILILSLTTPSAALASTDGFIATDLVAHTYAGYAQASQLISNLSFTDMPGDGASQDAIVRAGALNIIKGSSPLFQPYSPLSKEEAIEFIIRAVGMERQAQTAGVNLVAQLPEDAPLREVWSAGYMSVARAIGLITPAQFADALEPDLENLDDETGSFIRTSAATREEFAYWLSRALQYVRPNVFNDAGNTQSIYAYTDWQTIAPAMASAVENLLRANIMNGGGLTVFRPRDAITRIEAARAFKNMDNIYYEIRGLQKKTGTVAGFADGQYTETSAGQLWKLIYVRAGDGTLDVLEYTVNGSSSPQDGVIEAVTLRDGAVAGLTALQEGDRIEYLVEPATNTALYVQVTGGLDTRSVRGRLREIDANNGLITLTDNSGKVYVFPMADGLYNSDNGGSVRLYENTFTPVSSLPVGSWYYVSLVNNVATGIEYIGEAELAPETRGIVADNNPMLGYLTVYVDNGREMTFNYVPGALRVQKTEHYDMRDTIGSIHSLFPDFIYNPRETDISAVEAGDVVSFRTAPDDPSRITSISASTSYTTRYGRIREFRLNGRTAQMLMEYENGQTSWFTVADSIMILKGGRPAGASTVQPGDWARILVNQAVVAPGYVVESVKEMILENDAHNISAIVKGRLAGINNIQNSMYIENAQKLGLQGWSDYRQIEPFSLAGRNIEFYYNDTPVNLAYVKNYLTRADANVYIALENSYSGETIRRVTFRPGRDELLRADTVLSTDGGGGFTILSNANAIATDAGTIVRRNGRLVDGMQIMAPDYAVVSLNGGDTAAVVDITPAPATSGVMLARGRVYSVDSGRSFKVQSMALFNGLGWNYTPIQREFTIDNGTLFFDSGGGLTSINDFIGYTSESVVDRVYNIIIEGGRAARVIDSPYATSAVRGEIYQADNGSLSLRDMQTYDGERGSWSLISNRDATGTVTIPGNAVIIDRNAVVPASALRPGMQVRVMTTALPDRIASGLNVTGYIILVER